MKKKKLAKTKKEVVKKEQPIKEVKYIVVVKPPYDLFSFYFSGDTIEYFDDLKKVMKYVKDNRTAKSIRVFQVAEELKTRVSLELDL